MDKTENSFDKLVKKMGVSERLQLLEKINTIMTPENQSVVGNPVSDDDSEMELIVRLQHESIFIRIWLYIRSFFSKKEIEEEYNNHLVIKVGRRLESNAQGIFSYRNQLILSEFYFYLGKLSKVADFFQPGIIEYEENEGHFYEFLGTLVLTGLTEEYNATINPSNLPLDREVTNELRLSLIRKLEDLLANISSQDKGILYLSVQNISWLKEFVNLPFRKFMEKFVQLPNGSYNCPLDTVHKELALFATVFCNAKTVSSDVIEALYLFYLRSSGVAPESDDAKTQLRLYLNKSIECFNTIREFQIVINMHDIGIIAYNSANWIPDTLPGVEDWFIKFKKEWRKTFNADWTTWIDLRKNEETKLNIQNYFHISGFPVFPNRPWKTDRYNKICTCEYSLGFLYDFFTQLYPSIYEILKKIMLEGDFIDRDSEAEYTSVFDDLNHEQEQITELNDRLGEKGEWGETFKLFLKNAIHTIQGQAKLNTILVATEAEVHEIIAKFGKSCRAMSSLLNSIINGDPEHVHGIITNLDRLKNNEKITIREQVENILSSINTAYELLKEVESLELKQSKK
jgi:hypothetical protein